MVATAGHEIAGYIAGERPQLAASPDGVHAAVADATRVAVIDLDSLQLIADIPAASDDTQVGWLGTPAQLLVVTHEAQHTQMQLVQPLDGSIVAEVRFAVRVRLAATAGAYALGVSPTGAIVVHAASSRLTWYELPGRSAPLAAGSGTRELYIAHATGMIEEWDPQQRAPKRRLRLAKPSVIRAVGGSPRAVWYTTVHDANRVELIPSVNRGQPTAHTLPEPIAALCSHPDTSDLVCVGRSGKLHRVDLDGRLPLATLELGGNRIDAAALVAGRASGVLIARTGQALALVGSERSASELVAARTVAPAVVRRISPPALADASPVPSISLAAPAPAVSIETAVVETAAVETAPAEPLRFESLSLALAPRAEGQRAAPGEYQTMLDHYRRTLFTLASLAIARDWDSGRLSFATNDRPPFESEVLALVGRGGALAGQRVTEAKAAFQEASQALVAARGALNRRSTPIDILCAEHGISKNGELVLLAVAAPALWGEIGRLYGILANETGRATCDELLLVQLFRDTVPRREIMRELDPSAPLMRSGLIRASDRARPFQALGVDPVVVKLIADLDVEQDVEPGAVRVPPTVSLERFVAPRDVIERALADFAIAPPGRARIVVRGRSGVGRRTLLAALAQQAGRMLATIDAQALIRDKQVSALATLLQRVHMRGWLPCIDGLESIGSEDNATRGLVRDVLRDHLGPLAIRLPHDAQPPLPPGYIKIDLPTPTLTARSEQWANELSAHGLAARDLDALAARFTVGAGTIRRVVDIVARQPVADVDVAIEDAMRQHLESTIGEVASRVARLASWSQIVLPRDIHDSIIELISRARHRRTVYDTWGFDQVMSTSRGLTALFQGGPGTGKTLVAGAIARELGLDLYRIDLSRVISKWIGETEQNLARVLDAAEQGQAVILFDEADSLFAKRTAVRSSVDRYANIEVNYLLQRFDSFEGVAILTTNHGTSIDSAFARRLSLRLTFPFPDEEARERLWRVHLPDQVPRAPNLDLVGLARRFAMSGGYIRNAALRAAFIAAEERTPLSQEHLERAVRAEFREGGKLAESGVLE
jgi:hypothetical protein